jgi:predicted RNA binding protein YcfA (HicA-like mRNA interferase family)
MNPKTLTNSKKLIAFLEGKGFEVDSVRGSHHKLKDKRRNLTVIVPHPKKDLPLGTVKAILRQADVG